MQFVKSLAYLFDAIVSVSTVLYENFFLVKPFGWLVPILDELPDEFKSLFNTMLSVFLPGNPDPLGTLANATNVDLVLVWGVVIIVHSAFTLFILAIALKVVDIIL